MKFAFVTGSTSGIGYATAKQLSADGYQLVVHGRNGNKLKNVAEELNAYASIQSDLSSQDGLALTLEKLKNLDIDFDVAVNNAGFGLYGEQTEMDETEINQMLNVNISALTSLTHFFAKRMKANKKGYIMNVASTAAYQPQPYMAAYAASKAYVGSFTESLAAELEGTGVSVTCLSPGRTDTGFFTFDGKDNTATGKGIFSATHRVSPEKVARIGLDALFRNKSRVIPFIDNKLYVSLNRILPRNTMVKFYKNAMQNV